MKKFLIADDHSIVRTGISFLIRQEFPGAQIDTCADGHTAWRKIGAGKYDLAILDINMPGNDPVSLLRNISAQYPGLKVLILTMNREQVYAKKYLQLGIKGFVNKEAEPSELRRAMTTILEGKTYLSRDMNKLLLAEALSGDIPKNPFDKLTSRELEIMGHLVEGKSHKEIAAILSIDSSTVGSYKSNILQKLGLANVIELSSMVQSFPIK